VFGIRPTAASREKPHTLIQHTGKGTHPTRQMAAHAHAVVLSPKARFLLVPDLGANRVVMYRWDGKDGSLTPAERFRSSTGRSPGPAPHAAFSRGSRFAYVNHELNPRPPVYRFDEETGRLCRWPRSRRSQAALPSRTRRQKSNSTRTAGFSTSRIADTTRSRCFASTKGGTLSLIGHTPTGGMTPPQLQDRSERRLHDGSRISAPIRSTCSASIRQRPADDHDKVLSMPTPACVLFLPA
jgi:6-phosphogluconolactonase